MKLTYIVNARIPTEKAHGYQICKMCEEFARLGMEVELVCPTRENPITEDLFEYYGLTKNFGVRYVVTPDFLPQIARLGGWVYYAQSVIYVLQLAVLAIRADVVISRSPEIVWLFKNKGRKAIYDAHSWPESKEGLFRYCLKKADLIICNSRGTEKKFNDSGFSRTLAAPNGVDLKDFEIGMTKSELRDKLGLSVEKKVVMYVGHLYDWKGADTAAHAARLISAPDVLFVFVGGTEADIKRFRGQHATADTDNIEVVGHVRKNQIPEYLLSADILLLPNDPVSIESELYTSPLKMFEYMAAQRPIIASDLPSIREVLDESTAFFVKPGDTQDIVEKINYVLSHPTEASEKAVKARVKVQDYTWTKRAKKISDAIFPTFSTGL